MIHKYWGNVKEDWAGFTSDIIFSNPFFDKQNVEIFLGEEYDEDGEEIDTPPAIEFLDAFADTYQKFITNIEKHLSEIQQKAFDRYKKVYAHYYENQEKSGELPLNIDNVEKHNSYIKDLMYLRVLEDETIKLTIRYAIDTEQGLEFCFTSGMISAVGGIAET